MVRGWRAIIPIQAFEGMAHKAGTTQGRLVADLLTWA
jgi:hypothetical protein